MAYITTGLKERVTCPHDWHVFEPHKTLWIAKHPELMGDKRLGENHSLRFLPDHFTVAGDAIDQRRQKCTQLACPRCHLEVPRVMFEMNTLFWSVVGTPSCGKSYELASMTHTLKTTLEREFAVALTEPNPMFNDSLYLDRKRLFHSDTPEQLVRIVKTQNREKTNVVTFDGERIRYPQPFVFTVRPLKHHPRGDEAEKLAQVLCLYDNAGEDYNPGEDKFDNQAPGHVQASQVLMFLFDPTQDTRFRERCQMVSDDPQVVSDDPQVDDKDKKTRVIRDQVQVFDESVRRVREARQLSSHEKFRGWLFILVTKLDVWEPLLDSLTLRAPWHRRPGRTYSEFDLDYVEDVSAAVRDLLGSELSCGLVAAAESFAEHVFYLPVSATGTSPERNPVDGMLSFRPRDINPKWTEVPVLYALCRGVPGLIPRALRRSEIRRQNSDREDGASRGVR